MSSLHQIKTIIDEHNKVWANLVRKDEEKGWKGVFEWNLGKEILCWSVYLFPSTFVHSHHYDNWGEWSVCVRNELILTNFLYPISWRYSSITLSKREPCQQMALSRLTVSSSTDLTRDMRSGDSSFTSSYMLGNDLTWWMIHFTL